MHGQNHFKFPCVFLAEVVLIVKIIFLALECEKLRKI